MACTPSPTATDEVATEVSRRVLDVHRALVEEEQEPGYGSASHLDRTRFELFNLRWVVDAHELAYLQQLPERSREVVVPPRRALSGTSR